MYSKRGNSTAHLHRRSPKHRMLMQLYCRDVQDGEVVNCSALSEMSASSHPTSSRRYSPVYISSGSAMLLLALLAGLPSLLWSQQQSARETGTTTGVTSSSAIPADVTPGKGKINALTIYASQYPGIVADGATDTTTGLNKAINAICAVGAGTLILDLPGTYYLNSFSTFSGLRGSYHNLPLCSGLTIRSKPGANNAVLLQGPYGIYRGKSATAVLATPYMTAYTYQSDSYNKTIKPLTGATKGSLTVTASIASDANYANFAAGDWVYLANSSSGTGSNFFLAELHQIASTNPSTGLITFTTPIIHTFPSDAVGDARYLSGGTASGTGTCNVGTFNGGGTLAKGTIAVSDGALGAITITGSGYSYTSAPTTAVLTDGTGGICSGTITVKSTLVSAWLRNVESTTTQNLNLIGLTIQGDLPLLLSETANTNVQHVNNVIDLTASHNIATFTAIILNTVNFATFTKNNITCIDSTSGSDCNASARSTQQLLSRNSGNITWSNSNISLGGIYLTSENSYSVTFNNNVTTSCHETISFSGANVSGAGDTFNMGGCPGIAWHSSSYWGFSDGDSTPVAVSTSISNSVFNCRLASGGYCLYTNRGASAYRGNTIHVYSPFTFAMLIASSTSDSPATISQQVTGNTILSAGSGISIGGPPGVLYKNLLLANNTITNTGTTKYYGNGGVYFQPAGPANPSSVAVLSNNSITGYRNKYYVGTNPQGVTIKPGAARVGSITNSHTRFSN
jgi:hypothetical protein